MSYILEALKKSELERQQGKVPDLAAAPVKVLISPEPVPRLAYLGGAALLVILGILLGWWQPWEPYRSDELPSKRTPPAEPRAPLALEPSEPAAVAAAPVRDVHDNEPVGARLTPALPSAQAEPPAVERVARAAPAKSAPSPLAEAKPVTRASPREARTAAAPSPPADQVRSSKAAPPVRPPAQVSEARPSQRVLQFSELPPAIARNVPRISVSGFALTEDPESRVVVINDRMLREGEHVAADLRLERIGDDGVVLNYKGYRFRPAP